ncbi:MAG: hypothetical protein VCB07_08370 [Gammaproteobacteria bacterium]
MTAKKSFAASATCSRCGTSTIGSPLLAGLLQSIVTTVVISEAQKHLRAVTDIIACNHLGHELSGQVGAMVLRAWKFADVFPEAAFKAEFFTKGVPDRLHPCDVVMLALPHDDQPAPWSLDTSNRAELDIHTKLARLLIS